VLQAPVVQSWVLVSKTGEVVLLGNLEIDPTKSAPYASISLKKAGSKMWTIEHSEPDSLVNQLLFKNSQDESVMKISDNGQVDVKGDLHVGQEEAQIYLGQSSQWRIRKSVLDQESAFEIWDPFQQIRMRIHGQEHDYHQIQTSFATSFSVEDWAVEHKSFIKIAFKTTKSCKIRSKFMSKIVKIIFCVFRLCGVRFQLVENGPTSMGFCPFMMPLL
jgi:hypothetical protein